MNVAPPVPAVHMKNPSVGEMLPTRWSLLSRLKDWDDQESWRLFFELYWQLIYSTALKSGLSHGEAQDVVQEVIVSVAKKIGAFRTDPKAGSFKHWLLKLTRWRIQDQFRRRDREPPRHHRRELDDTAGTGTVDKVADPLANLDVVWDREWQENLRHAAMERAKARVKPEMYQLFDLVVCKGWPALKVARKLHVTLAQVYYARWKVSSIVRSEANQIEKAGI